LAHCFVLGNQKDAIALSAGGTNARNVGGGHRGLRLNLGNRDRWGWRGGGVTARGRGTKMPNHDWCERTLKKRRHTGEEHREILCWGTVEEAIGPFNVNMEGKGGGDVPHGGVEKTASVVYEGRRGREK